jgi:methyltransferase (TIGR00027 family)
MENRASVTAEYMALFRALESSRPEGLRLFCDPLAPIFLSSPRSWFCRIGRIGTGRWFIEGLLDRKAPGAWAAGIARTKWIDDEVTQALQTASQLVLLGAGFDTRAFRLECARRVTAFEVDRAETSVAKQAALRGRLGSLPERVRFVTIDFNRQSIADVLAEAGFDWGQAACFVWEGVTNYLTDDAVDGTLRQLAGAAAGSVLLFTYIHRGVLDAPGSFFGADTLMARLRGYGEPWTFGIYPERLEEYLAARGWELIKDLSVAEIWKKAGRSVSDARGYEFYRLAAARLVGIH